MGGLSRHRSAGRARGMWASESRSPTSRRACLRARIIMVRDAREREVEEGPSTSRRRSCRRRSSADFPGRAAGWSRARFAGPAGNNHRTEVPTGLLQNADGHINSASTGQKIWERLCKADRRPSICWENPGYVETPTDVLRTATPSRRDPRYRETHQRRWIERLKQGGVRGRQLCWKR